MRTLIERGRKSVDDGGSHTIGIGGGVGVDSWALRSCRSRLSDWTLIDWCCCGCR